MHQMIALSKLLKPHSKELHVLLALPLNAISAHISIDIFFALPDANGTVHVSEIKTAHERKKSQMVSLMSALTALVRCAARAVSAALLCNRSVCPVPHPFHLLIYPSLHLAPIGIPPLTSYSFLHPSLPSPLNSPFTPPYPIVIPSLHPTPSSTPHTTLLLIEQEKCPEFWSKVQGPAHRGTLLRRPCVHHRRLPEMRRESGYRRAYLQVLCVGYTAYR
jgi:hypothetical protein